MFYLTHTAKQHIAWNKGKLIGQEPPFKLREIWAIRIRLQLTENHQELALLNIAIESKLRSCDLLKLHVSDISHGNQIAKRAMVLQQKTKQPVRFEITEQTREARIQPLSAILLAVQTHCKCNSELPNVVILNY